MRVNEITNNTDLNDLKDNSRAEADLVEMVNKLYGEAGGTLPVPKSRMEFLLHAIYEKLGEGGGGGSVDPADIETVVRAWFEEHSEAVATGFNVEFVDDGIEFTNDQMSVEEAVAEYLDDHPEATTTVQDGVISYAKLDSNLKAKADDVSDLKSQIDDITDVVQSPNLFDQEGATVVEGKYLNYTTGNEGTNASYSYCADYIPVKPNTQYYGATWRKSDGQYTGAYGDYVIFYDENKGYLSGLSGSSNQNPFTTPSNCAFMRLSFSLSGWTEINYMFVEGSTAPTAYIPYYSTKMLKLPFVVVDANGNGSFTSIADAVTAAESGSTIIVMPGTYEENVKAWGKKVNIVGLSKEGCVIKDTSGNYATPPLEIGAGSIQNMSIIEAANGAGTASQGAYAIHVESNNLFNEKLLIRNCYIYSDSSSAIGMGLRGGCSVRIEDSEIICAGARASTGAAPLYFHDADAQAYWGTANLYLHGNVLRNTASTLFSMLTINSIHKENTTYMHMMYNIFVRSKTPALSQKFNTWNTSGNSDADGWNGLSHMYLEDDSFGNNLTELNYSE